MIFEFAGIAGVQPWRFTFWELRTMAEARLRSEWDRTALVACLLHNTHVGRGQQRSVSQFHPYAPPPKRLSKTETGNALADAFFPTRKLRRAE